MTSAIDILCIAALLPTCAGLIWTDLRSGLLPDWMNAIIAISGLVRMAAGDDPSSALWGAAAALAVGIVLLLLRRLYAMVRGRQGLGLGDVKFLMAATLWTGLSGLPILLLVATMTALAGVLVLFVMGRRLTGQTALPFGPFLVIGLLAVLVLQAIGSDLVLPA
ncbi:MULTISPECIES: prepilin peptidase [Bradyrhizobium]|uniref:Prepilin peptidase n=1 Tax=Bradyrhizobium denitrificans TaxID=2734912 RepID=A0ABS5GEP1_9BRAD|nr:MULTISPECIES: A24 family peptidase [Bradyrhizobium]RTM03086.1 MAG: prepilin peptidase [Bradyrhizobiaceae bacterium]ABQ33528.1 putative Type II secretory pathway, prepilin signal peptidase [Bradyrhizobium sp. BTAi1]MBR1139790.1 prepilin peptidase [Bradyrhizobium denitrificans]MCL8487133.1 A24 family peptidase [Bradyrhizobium denitrificans]MDU1493883.1 A24 family peptidase [Bradyrhizobium sp.]